MTARPHAGLAALKPLAVPTSYRTTRAYRIGSVVAGLVACFGGIAFFVMLATADRSRNPHPPSVLEWLFVGAVATAIFAFGVYRLVLAARHDERMRVTTDGILFRGVRRERRIAWSEIVRARPSNRRGGGALLELTVREAAGLGKVILDLNGVSPGSMEFRRQLWHYAPAALAYETPFEKWLRKIGLVRYPKDPDEAARKIVEEFEAKLGPPPGPPPDFDEMRAEARAVATGKDLEDLLAATDDLERRWKPFLDKEKKR